MKSCNRKYQTNFSDLRFQRSYVAGVYNSDANTLRFFFTNPFLLVGLVSLVELPEGETPSYPNSLAIVRTAAIQRANIEFIEALFIALGFANAQPTGVSNGMTAYSEGDFSEYMYRYLNPQILGAYYPIYTQPGSSAIQFWKDEVTIADPGGMNDRFNAFLDYLASMSSVPLYNPPGEYIIDLSVANTEPYIADLKTYLAANSNTIYLMCLNQNSPDLAPEATSSNPLANTINSINFAGEVPNAILWG